MKVKNKIVALMLCMLMVFTIPNPVLAAADEFVDSGSGLKFKVLTEDTATNTGTVQVIENNYSDSVYIIPDTVTYDSLTYTVTGIGFGAFSNCTGLTSVSLPEHLTDIGNFAFDGCSSLGSIDLPDGMTGIGISAFRGSGIASVTIPDSVETIWDWAFSNCTSLTTVTFLGVDPPTIYSTVFSGAAVETAVVPMGAQNSYWFATSGKLPAGAQIIPAAATITGVSVNPAAVAVAKGGMQIFSASVDGTGSFSEAVTWSVTGGSYGTRIDNGTLIVAVDEASSILTVKAESVADSGAYGEAAVNVTTSAPQEQFSLPVGSTCYFDLSGQSFPGTLNASLPDSSLKWVPFTYAGTVDAYSLDAGAEGSTSASEMAGAAPSRHSLFVADHNICKAVSWATLNTAGLIFGRDYSANGVSYRLRSLSVGSGKNTLLQVIPQSNEWDQILMKGNDIPNNSGVRSWGQDTYNSDAASRVYRGQAFSAFWYYASSTSTNATNGFRPALEVLNPSGMGFDGLKAVTYDMGGNGTLGSGVLTSATVAYTDMMTLPTITPENGFQYTGPASGSGTDVLGWSDGTTFYEAGTTAAFPAGTTLTPAYGPPSVAPVIVTTSLPDGTVGAEYDASIEATGTAPMTWILSDGTLPDGIDLESDGDLSGMPSAAGTFLFTVMAANARGSDTQNLSITVGAVSNGGDSSSGGGTSSTAPTPEYKAEVDVGNGSNTTLPIIVDKNSGRANVDVGTVKGLMSGGKTAVVTVPSVPGVDTYSLGVPVPALATADGQSKISFKTSCGIVTVPSNMLADIEGISGSKAQISIGQGNKDTLDEDVKTVIGDRPLVQLTLFVDGKQLDWSNSNAPVTVSIPYTPTADELKNSESIVIWYIDGGGNVASVPNGRWDPAAGAVTFFITHFSNYAVAYNRMSFKDVTSNAWYDKAVSFLAARGITSGTGGNNYSPESKLTRGEFIVLMMRAYGIAPDRNPADNFSDAGNTYYTGYLAAAKRLGITAGAGNNMYAPGKEITRQELITLLVNALKAIDRLPHGNSGKALSGFKDADQIAPWAKDSMTLLVETGTVGGNGGKLGPKEMTTRAETAQVLYNMLGKGD